MKPTLLMICIDFPTKDFPERGIFFQDHANALSLIFDVTVAHIQIPSFREVKRLNTVLEETKTEHIRVISLKLPVLTHRFQNSIEKAYQKAADELSRKVHPDLILAQTALPPGEIAQTLSLYHKKPYFIYDHYSFLEDEIEQSRERYFNIYSDANAILAVSDNLCETIEMQTGFEVFHQPNCLGREYSHLEISVKPPQNPCKLLWVGRNHEVKQPEFLFDILPNFTSSFDWELTIVARDFDVYKKKLDKKYSKNVTFIESAKRETLIDLFQSHHITLSTSKTETFGLSLLESLACGTPVISTPCGGPSQFINRDNGVIIDHFSPEDMAIAIETMCEQYGVFSHNEIAKEALRQFGAKSFCQKFSKVVSTTTNINVL